VVLSNQPGSAVGVPGNASTGVLAMSPAGGSKPGAGGSGGGTGIGHGPGPGSGLSGEGSGAAKEGTGRGSDPNAHTGISPYPGTGGTGNGTSGQAPIPGVSVQGGGTINLPSFGPNENDPSSPGRSLAGTRRHHGLDVTVEGGSRSGGGFNAYGQLKGDNYTIYIPTTEGNVVMQYSDPLSATTHYLGGLTQPQALRTPLPPGLPRTPVKIACVLDRSGILRDLQVLEPRSGGITAKILASLASWKFTPAFRGSQAVEVTAILGFNINTQ